MDQGSPQEQLVNLVDPDTNEIGSLPASQAQAALAQGFTPASQDQVNQHFKAEKYGTTGQQIATGLESAGSSLSFGATTGAERMLGVPAEDIQARREINPGSHVLGDVAGLGLGMLTGSGEAAILERAGLGTAKMLGLGLEGAGALSKIGSSAAKLAVENSLFSAGDEVSKMFSGADQSVGAVMADVGLSALIGGGLGGFFGSVSPLWKATVGSKVSGILGAIKAKAGGIEGELSAPVKQALSDAGIEMAPEIKAGLSDDLAVQNMFKTLEQSDTTKSGQALQNSYNSFRGQAAETIVHSLGRAADDVSAMGDLSKYESGKAVGHALADEVAAKIEPLSNKFNELKERFADTELVPDTTQNVHVPDANNLAGAPAVQKIKVPGTASQLVEKIAQLAQDEGWTALHDNEIMGLANKAMKSLPKQTNLKELGNLISAIGSEANKDMMNLPLKRAGELIKGVLKDAESDIIGKRLGQEGPQLLDEYVANKSAFREAAKLKDALDDRLKIRGSVSGFAKNIREMANTDAEALLRKISGAGDADGLRLLKENFPKTAERLGQYHVDSLLKLAADKAKPGTLINAKALINAIEKMSPEMREFAINPAALKRVGAIGTLLEQFEKAPHNFSNTARTMDKLFKHVPAGAVGAATMIAGHNPAVGLLMGGLAHYASGAPDAVRLATLKFLGSSQALESGAFKSMVTMAEKVQKGELALTRATRGVLRTGSKVAIPKDVAASDRQKLDKRLLALQKDPSPLLNIGGDIGHYMPEHAAALAQSSAQAVNYLNSLRPVSQKTMPLDEKMEVDAAKRAEFDRALDIAENPLLVLEHVKNGTLMPSDVVTLKNVAPGLYERMNQKLMDELVSVETDDDPIPYRTRLGLALFMGQPLDSTMTPMGIQSAQPKNSMPQQSQVAQGKPSQAGLQKLSKLGPGMATGEQAREMGRTRHLS